MINKFRLKFGSKVAVLPVIHVQTLKQTQKNVRIVKRAGCTGMFLIGHGINEESFYIIQNTIALENPELWIGVNYLWFSAKDAAEQMVNNMPRTNGLWTDQANISNHGLATETYAKAKNFMYFGGVDFKYQTPEKDKRAAAKLATHYMDVICTSGVGTGHAPNVGKIIAMKEAVGDFPIAIASGITPENANMFLGYADCFMVATGISQDFQTLDQSKLEALLKTVA